MSSTRSAPGGRASPNDGLRRRKPDPRSRVPGHLLHPAAGGAPGPEGVGVRAPAQSRPRRPSSGNGRRHLAKTGAGMADRIQALIPDLDAYATRGMKAFDVPGLAIGIVAGDKFVYAKGFGVRSKGGGQPVDTRTVFQIGSATKAFLATSLAIM